ncbi:MAG: glucuronate isomerase [Oscillospiraceae bacterium]|nr:glucuronate isomerase [Oscillospiraceae bacterium]
MKAFMDKDFLLSTDTAKTLYHQYAAKMPIIDYHCHINPAEIANNRRFDNITQVWLGGDHYKWRVMRGNGVEEKYITGDASDREKFQKFAEALPRAIGNPMYHWCHLELKTYFGYNGVLNGDTAEEVWNLCNAKLKEDNLSVRGLIEQSNVVAIGTTDDPIDTLEWHEKIANDDTCKVKVIPSYRPDKAINLEKADFVEYVQKLSVATGIDVKDLNSMRAALTSTVEKFAKHGCKASDHGIDYIMYREADDATVDVILKKALAGEAVSFEESEMYKTAILVHLGRQYKKNNIVMQLHYGAIRNTNTLMFNKLGPDTGFDSIANTSCALGVVGFLNALNMTNELPKTILYSLNPNDDAILGTILGCFQSSEAQGKIQHGSAWWFNDTKSGMIAQMTSLANLGLLGNFVGMLTDSRSFLSYTRHDYFRRILCELLGGWVENGEYPADIAFVGSLVEDICYNNANRYFFG